MPIEDRLPYLRKLKAFLEADPLDMAAFEREFGAKFVCRPWRNTGQICDYYTNGVRWPYAVFEERESVVRYRRYGDGTDDSLLVSLLYPHHRGAHNCITGEMVQQVFTPPGWSTHIGMTDSKGTRPVRTLLLALEGRDQMRRRVTLVSAGVKGCSGTLEITVQIDKPQ